MPPLQKTPISSLVFCILFLTFSMVAGCNSGEGDLTPVCTPTPTRMTTLPTETSELANQEPHSLTIWTPPILAPETPAGALLVEHLAAFEDAYDLIKIDLRIKNENGPAGILETLCAASLVAPSTLPEIVLLDSADLNTAALKGLILSLEEIIPIPATPEWYEFAVDAAHVDSVFYGLPFISEAEAFAFRKGTFEAEPKDWADLLASEESVLFPLGDKTSKFTLIQYLASGGKLVDDAGSPTIDTAILADLLLFYLSANESGQLPLYALQLQSVEDTSSALLQGNTNAAVIPLELLRQTSIRDSYSISPWPTRDGTGVTPTKTLSWAVVLKGDEQEDHIAQILQWLTEPSFLGKISQTLGFVPVTPAALQKWSDLEASAIISRLVRVAVPEPSIEETTTFGLLLWTATEDLLYGRSTPETAAESIYDQVAIP